MWAMREKLLGPNRTQDRFPALPSVLLMHAMSDTSFNEQSFQQPKASDVAIDYCSSLKLCALHTASCCSNLLALK